MNYIADTLGIEVVIKPWNANAGLPYYITDAYGFQAAKLDKTRCLLIEPKGELAAIPALKKHLSKISECTDMLLVLDVASLNAKQRKALIAAKIPFVARGSGLYLPFLGAALTERFLTRSKASDILSPTAQLLFFRYIYQGESEMYLSGLAELFGVSAMQITRAVKQLAALELIKTRKDGVQVVISGAERGSALLEKAKSHLLNPVRKCFYINKAELPLGLPLAGESALAEFTMLNPPQVAVYAFYGKVNALSGTETLVEPETQVKIEVWRYSPSLLSLNKNLPDRLSLWLSLSDDDARIEIAKEELLAELWRIK